ncbi:non-lysosomal glucosylceramidase-like [Rhopilema esculentum]|uniref:non-lysosomal glucosylceramidase-like n=1 Tax=Rhopilema esculentum TaxID=499914 RepID=UPI0031D491CC
MVDCNDSPEQRHIPPEYGWRVRLDHNFPDKPKASVIPRWHQVPKLVGMAYRFLKYARSTRKKGRMPYIDPYATVPCKQLYGVPLGGIGAGAITRGWKGDFNRWQLHPGIYERNSVDVNQFTVCIRKNKKTVYQHVLSPNAPSGKLNCEKTLQGWKWNFHGGHAVYHALYPRAWTVYEIPEHKVRLTCRQVSPVFPHEYKDTSLPVGVFVWTVENLGNEEIEVSIMFTFQNGTGGPSDEAGGHYNEAFMCKGVFSEVQLHEQIINRRSPEKRGNESPAKGSAPNASRKPNAGSSETCVLHDVSGVLLHHAHQKNDFTLAIAAKHVVENGETAVSVSTKVSFDSKTPCRKVWEDLFDDGLLSNKPGDPNRKSYPGQTLAAAVASKTRLLPHQKRDLEFVLAWDMPVVEFGSGKGVKYCRRYTKFFGDKRNAAPSLCCYALLNYPEWESRIEKWQNPILNDSSLPDWYKSALFNELYYVTDGGTIWLDIRRKKDLHRRQIPNHVHEYGRFAYLEGHEYRMYNTYDVHFYASWALIMLWPQLQLSLQYDIAASVLQCDTEERLMMMEGHMAQRKVPSCIPHDIGDPEEEPFLKVNAYTIHDTSTWKDLNLKFVLQVYRDYKITKNLQFLMDMWPAMKACMSTATGQDSDCDGLIDNSGFADQTFDCWVVTGASAYCGGLWLGALRCMVEIATILKLDDNIDRYKTMLSRGKEAYERKLWNGTYYNYDSSDKEYHNSIMAHQCAGQWYIHACDLGQSAEDRVFPKDHIESAMKTVFQMNVMRYQGGFMGAVNGMRPDGRVDTSSLQAEEVWTGVTYAVAASMIQEGMVQEGFRTAEGIYRTCFEKLGLGFQTPEAFLANGNFRSLGYMRPLSIWGMQHALEKTQTAKEDSETVMT